MARFLLVHGAMGGAWVWERVIPGLEAAGHTAEAIDLPGQGADRHRLGRSPSPATPTRCARRWPAERRRC